jgi:hypothetical protein
LIIGRLSDTTDVVVVLRILGLGGATDMKVSIDTFVQ